MTARLRTVLLLGLCAAAFGACTERPAQEGEADEDTPVHSGTRDNGGINADGLTFTIRLRSGVRCNPIIMGITIFSVILVVAANLVVDLLQAMLDPRVRLE